MKRFQLKNSWPYLKCVLRLSCVVHGPIYGRFMGFYVNGFLSIEIVFFFPIQILIFWMLRNNADARRCSYFELGATCGIHCKFFHTDFFLLDHYRAFQIPRLFPRRPYCKSVKAIQSHRPGVKIWSKCQQVPKVKPRPSRDKCILKAK